MPAVKRNAVDCAAGRVPADLAIVGGNIVDVWTEKIWRADVAVKGSLIARVGDVSDITGRDTAVIEADGKFVAPGLIDAHIHVESSMVTLASFAEAVLPSGTTGVVVDPHEIANVSGVRGVMAMVAESKLVPLRVYFMVPSCVPATLDFETSGAALSVKAITGLLRRKEFYGLAEMMNFPGVITGDKDALSKIEAAEKLGKVVDGHAPMLGGRALAAYRASGVLSDHETSSSEEAIEKLRSGMTLQLREGSAAKNLRTILSALIAQGISMESCTFCCDDRDPGDLLEDGHINAVLKKAVSLGLTPARAVKIASLNACRYLGLRDRGVIAPGTLADLAIFNDLSEFGARDVIVGGRVVLRNGNPEVKIPIHRYPEAMKHSVHVKRLRKEQLIFSGIKSKRVKARVIVIVPDQILTRSKEAVLEVKDGVVSSDASMDIMHIAVVERHGKKGSIGRGFVSGTGLKEGAIASTVAHDSHNLIVIGENSEDMLAAVNAIKRMQGGLLAVKNGKVLAKCRLEIAGLITQRSVKEVSSNLKQLHSEAKMLGCTLGSPFLTMSFLALPVIPELKLTDRGLVDVNQFKFVDVIIEQ